MLWDTLDTECLVLASDGVDEVVVRDSDGSGGSSSVRQVWIVNGVPSEILLAHLGK